MELSTKKIFSSKLNNSKKKLILTKKNTSSLNCNIKLKKTIKNFNRTITKEKGKNKINKNDIPLYKEKNPFSSGQIKLRNKTKHGYLSSKNGFIKLNAIEKKHVLNSKKEGISDFTNIISTTCSDTYRQKQDYFDLDKLCDEFQNSELKSNFIIDKNGNNILNLDQKRTINNYSSNKKENLQNNINKCKINEMEVKKSNLFRKEYRLFISKNNKYKYSFDIRTKFLSSKEQNKIMNLFNADTEKRNYNDDSRDNNSLFETLSNKSMDSSFICSDEDEKLILSIQDSCTKN